ncbi:MAG: InlB B-repeat-containing protein [Bacilli bacterium]|nr:InlB B-repeat-containing protein [Bacilli bacterium]
MRNFKTIFMLILFFVAIMMTACTTKFKVKFDLNYQDASDGPLTQEVVKGEKATEPLAPARVGYDFLGWFKNDKDIEPYDFNLPVEANITLYAKWKEKEAEVTYYLAGSFNAYVPNDAAYVMTKDKDGLYTFTVELTADNRDTAYDGHYYKVTNGTWDADGCYGVDNYYINPAPSSPTGGGLGSIWHWANGSLTVKFDAEELLITDTLVMEEDVIEELEPRIYGKFNGWVIDGDNAQILTDPDGDGIYTIEIDFAEGGTSDFTVCLSRKWYDDEWGQRWGANEQYKLDGTAAGMGNATEITYEVGKYLFSYNSATKITTHALLVADYIDEYSAPRLYGKFNGWVIDGDRAYILTDPDGDGIYTLVIDFAEGDTSDFTVCLSRKWYDDEWGKRWGANEQYKFDGTAAGMGDATEITYEAGTYFFSYNSVTKVTTYAQLVADYVDEYSAPRLYGKFNGWAIDGLNAMILTDPDGDSIYTLVIDFVEGGTSDFTVCLSRKWFDDEWGQRWGANEQYKFDGTAAGMGNVTEITYEAGTYQFSYNCNTKVTAYTKIS